MKKCNECGYEDADTVVVCSSCGTKYDENCNVFETGGHGIGLTDKNEICYDCLKTKGFVISIPVIVITVILTLAAMYGQIEIKWFIFGFGWGVGILITGLAIYASFTCIRDYCKVNGEFYKDSAAISHFALYTIISLIGIIVIIMSLPDNLIWIINHDIDGNLIIYEKGTDL